MTLSVEERLADALEELALVRAGRPFHIHTNRMSGATQRCSSPYCTDLSEQGIVLEARHA
jgi:hypothetical protein